MSAQNRLFREFNSRKFTFEELRYLAEKFGVSSRTKKGLAEELTLALLGKPQRRDREYTGKITFTSDSEDSLYSGGRYAYNPPFFIGLLLNKDKGGPSFFMDSYYIPEKFQDVIEALGNKAVEWVKKNGRPKKGTTFGHIPCYKGEGYPFLVKIEYMGELPNKEGSYYNIDILESSLKIE